MKRKSSVLLGLFCTALLLLSAPRALTQTARPPTQLTYQGFLTDGNGAPFGPTAPVNKTVIFRIYDALTGGTIKWSSQQVVTVDKGYFSVLLGQGSAVGSEPFSADLTGVFTGSPTVSDRYLELTADGVTIAPRLRFLPAPYALLARSATELLDPLTGVSSLSIGSGNATFSGTISGTGANLTNLNASQIATGTLDNARTSATSANNANAIIARDASGNFTAGTITASAFNGGGGNLTSLNASQITTGTLDNARTSANTTNTPNAIVARDGSGNINVNQVVASSFKINNTQTLVLYAIQRFPFSALSTSASPIPGVSQTVGPGFVGRTSNPPNNWYLSTSTSGTVLYTCGFTVPQGEVWDVVYTCSASYQTDDIAGLCWTVNDVVTDDYYAPVIQTQAQGYINCGQNFTFTGPSTMTVRVKAVIGNGSGSDYIYFPLYGTTPANCVVRKYKSN